MDEGYIVKNPYNRLVIHGDVEYRKDEIEVFDGKDLKLIVNSKENTLIKNIVLVCLVRCNVNYKKSYTLRHIYATKQFEADVPIKVVSKLFGHTILATTYDIYTYVLKE